MALASSEVTGLLRQWSAGELPQVKYNSEFESAYDVTKLTGKPEGGKWQPTSRQVGHNDAAPGAFECRTEKVTSSE